MATETDTSKLTQSQELIFLGEQLFPGSPMNNMAFCIEFYEAIDSARFRRAFADLVASCDALRMIFPIINEEVVPKVLPALAWELPIYDLSDTNDPEAHNYTGNQQACRRPLDLQERCFDASLTKLGEQHYSFYLCQHHLTTDGWGMANELRWLFAAYAGTVPSPLPEYAAYVADAARERKADTAVAGRQAWLERVADFPTPPLLYGRGNPRRLPASHRSTNTLRKPKSEALRALALQPEFRTWTPDLSQFNLFATVLFAFLYRVSGQTDLVVGTPAHNRVSQTDKATAGLFMELFPLRVLVDPADTFTTLYEKVRDANFELLRYARSGTSSVDTGRSFNVVFNYLNVAFLEEDDNLTTVEWLHPGQTEPGHHLKFQVYDFMDRGLFTLGLDRNQEVFTSEILGPSTQTFLESLDQLLENPEQPIAEVGPTERANLAAFNHQDENYPQATTVVELFKEQAGAHPDAPAVRFRELTLTYAELDRKTDVLAQELREQGVAREEIVAVCLDRSEKMLIALLGILKAGAAYLPVDPEFPQERKDFLGADAGARWWISTDEANELQITGGSDRRMNQVADVPISADERPQPEDLMYVLYTSGSTGKPKGVMNQHDGLVNRLWWMQKAFQLDRAVDVVLQKTTFTFDVSGWEFWWPLITGCPVVFAEPGGHKEVDYLQRTIREYGVTTLHFVPPMLELFLLKSAELPSLKRVICSGEALTPSQVNNFRVQYPEVELHNLYGPTEAAIDVTHWPAPTTIPQPPITHVPIGKPIDNVPIRILGPEQQLRPIGVPGELYIGGIQVARGYLNRPALTAEKFVSLPDGSRWYRTGDLARWLPDGNIDFLGRIDSQVKLRGFRIELGEVENALLQANGILQATVLLKRNPAGEGFLTAYFVAEGSPETIDLRSALTSKLPNYMVPTYFVQLPELPSLPNGKTNRKALPDPDFGGGDLDGDVPQTEFEEMIHSAWVEVFDREAIGRKAHFLDLGGHSLTGIRLVNRINEAFELELPANTIFRFPSIASLAEHVEETIRTLLEEMDDN